MMERVRVIETYKFYVEGVEGYVVGEVLEALQGPEHQRFWWHISHHYQAKPQSAPYYPSGIFDETLEDARALLMTYASGFHGAHKIVEG